MHAKTRFAFMTKLFLFMTGFVCMLFWHAFLSTAAGDLPEKPYGTRISGITDEGIEVYWKNTEFADGYEVSRSYTKEKGSWERVADGDTEEMADVSERSHSTWLDRTFDHSKKTVYYRLRSYEFDEQGERVYSHYSKVLTARYRGHLVISQNSLYLPANMTRTLVVCYGWGNAKDVIWYSEDPKVASVDADGVVTGISAGVCDIVCESDSLGEACSCTVTVQREADPPLEEITSRYQQVAPCRWENPDAPDTGDAVIMLTGDMMCTGAQQKAAGADTGDLNFNESFDMVKDIVSGADFAIGNLETLLSAAWPYMYEESYVDNKPNCNAPPRYLDALKYAGFDGLVMSNNHNCDGGEQGAIETEKHVEEYQFAHTGVFSTADEERTLLVNVNGIQVGFLSYTPHQPGFNGKDRDWPQAAKDTILNYYAKDKAAADIASLREDGAEYIVVYIHWGVKNQFGITDVQKEAAQELADLGVDYIVGGHSHLLQPFTMITASDGRLVPCFYSLGDFNASVNQIPGNRDSVILRIRLKKNKNGKVELAENNYIPCYTYTDYQEKSFVTVPLQEKWNGSIAKKNSGKFRERIAEEVGNEIQEY